MAQFTFRAATEPTVHWSKAGDKTYGGLAIIRETPTGDCADMFRLSDKTSPGEYRAFGAACVEAAELASVLGSAGK